MSKRLKLLLKVGGIVLMILVAWTLFYIFALLSIDLTHCRETIPEFPVEQGFIEKEIGQLYANMYAKEFDLKASEVRTYTQLAPTTTDFTVGHIYLKSPEGIVYVCGWDK